MADSFETHKTRINDTLRTPAISFRRLNRHRDNLHREGEVGRFTVTFDGEDYTFFAQLERATEGDRWHITLQQDAMGGRAFVSNAATWEACYAEFATWWERFCDNIRSTNATREYGLDLIDDTYKYNDTRIIGIRSTQGALTLVPPFAQSTREYAGSSPDPVLNMVVDRKYSGQTITNRWGESERVGTTRLINISQPENNPFQIFVVAEDGNDSGMYSITFSHALPSADTRLTSITISATTGAGVWPVNPTFDEDIREYAAAATANAVTFTATRKSNGQVVSWSNGSEVYEGLRFSQDPPVGQATIELVATVTAEDGSTTGTYTFTIQRG